MNITNEEEEETGSGKETYRYWTGKIETELGRSGYKRWVNEAKSITHLYECKEDNGVETPFNILNSNTEILLPALLGECPQPIVKKRFDDKEDSVATAASEIVRKTLENLQDPNEGHLDDFEELMREAVLSALVPGRGATCFHYVAKIGEEYDSEDTDDEKEGEKEESEDKDKDSMVAEKREVVEREAVLGENIEYNKLLIGNARSWGKVPWIAYEFNMTRDELVENFGDDKGRKVKLGVDREQNRNGEEREDRNTATVWQIWDKTRRKVLYISDGYTEGLLKESEDPLKLEGFFNIPKPLQFLRPLKYGEVIPLYEVYKIQAEELNVISQRIKRVTRMLKVRGAYDGQFQDLATILSQDDGAMVPLDNFSSLTGGKGSLDNAIWLVPIEKLVGVLQQLYVQRDQCKQTIYELTGITDIMRGASRASETLGAQAMKQQSGSVRLRKLQKEVARYARDCLRLMAEIAIKHFSQKSWQMYSEVDIPTKKAKEEQLQQIMQQIQQTQQQNPKIMEQVKPMLDRLQKMATWEDVMKLLKDDAIRTLRIDIETDSTLDVLATEDKQQVGEFLNAMSQFLNGIMPLMNQGLMPFEAVKSMMIAVLGKFRFSEDVIKDLEKMQQPPPKQPEPDPAGEAKAQSEQMKGQMMQQKMQMDGQKGQIEMQKAQVGLETEKAKGEAIMMQLQADMQKMQGDMEVARQKNQQEMQALSLKSEAAQKAHEVKMNELYAKMLADEHTNSLDK